MWIAKVKKDYEDAGGEEAECNQITVKEIPDQVDEVDGKGKEEVVAEVKPAAPAAPKPTPKDKIRHEWYQSTQGITIDLLASGVPKEQVEVKFEQRSVSNLPTIVALLY
jgi:suppressor of G2 allele of SKP1